ncbi:MAG: SDR family oxidoreductase [Cyclobacteriaceae bacterium]|nr:SDR family oxidoreductase [Cyclobacteriaceae bacterium]
MNLSLQHRNALVCGSTQGIGRAAAFELALLGATVTLLARSEEKLRALVTQLPTPNGQRHGYLVADFADAEQVRTVVMAASAQNDFHVLVNNTGGPPAGPALDSNTAAFVQAFSSHLLCNHILVQAVVPAMKKAGYGRIVNVISTSVKIPIRGLGVSNTIRGAVANWAKTLSVELGPFGITVNNVLPGSTMTGRLEAVLAAGAARAGRTVEEETALMIREIPAGRIGAAEEVAAAIAFLATPAAAYINGINIPVDGGRTGSL